MIELVVVAVLGALAWFWLDSLKTREIAIAAAKRACDADA
jgi:hypothetical protein